MDNFGRSVLAAAKGEPTPEGGYPGSYIGALATRVLQREPKLLELDEAVAMHTATETAYELQLAEIRSWLAAANGEPPPESDYPGSYIGDLAARVLQREPKLLELDDAVALHTATEIAYELQLAEIRASLERFNVHFDVWTSERRLQDKGDDGLSDVDTAVERLRAQGHVFDEDDAVWVRTTDFGDDKDRVIRRGTGAYTYFAADAAYYLDKG